MCALENGIAEEEDEEEEDRPKHVYVSVETIVRCDIPCVSFVRPVTTGTTVKAVLESVIKECVEFKLLPSNSKGLCDKLRLMVRGVGFLRCSF